MKGLLATNGTIPSSSYRNAFSPPIHTSTTTSPTRVTVTPTRSSRAASSTSPLILSIVIASVEGAAPWRTRCRWDHVSGIDKPRSHRGRLRGQLGRLREVQVGAGDVVEVVSED